MQTPIRGLLFAAAYLGSIVVATWAVDTFQIVPVGFGLMAPAAAYVIGVTMVLRDLSQDQLGPVWTYVALLVGAGLSFLVNPLFAAASAVAFLVSETADMIVYTPIRRRSIVAAVLTSNAVAIVVDSFLFVQIAFGNQDLFWGQVLAKTVSTIAVALVLLFIYRGRQDHTPAYIRRRELVNTQ